MILSSVVLVAFTYQMGWSVGSKDTEAQGYRAEYAERTDSRIAECFRDSAPPRECVEKAIRENYEQQRAEDDLNAQRQMADWAFWMLAVGALSFVVTSIGTIFLAWQVYLTREAVEDTGKGTRAMRKANKIAIKIGRTQVKAYISITSFSITLPESGRPVIKIGLKNYGQTPACGVRFQYEIIRPGDEWCHDFYPDDSDLINCGMISAGDRYRSAGLDMPRSPFHFFKEEIAAKSHGVWVRVTVFWEDVFEVTEGFRSVRYNYDVLRIGTEIKTSASYGEAT